MTDDTSDEALGITRCVQCGHRLDGEIECPFCSVFSEQTPGAHLPKWIFLTACFLTSPLSLYSIIKTGRLNICEKVFAFSGCVLWATVYRLWF